MRKLPLPSLSLPSTFFFVELLRIFKATYLSFEHSLKNTHKSGGAVTPHQSIALATGSSKTAPWVTKEPKLPETQAPGHLNSGNVRPAFREASTTLSEVKAIRTCGPGTPVDKLKQRIKSAVGRPAVSGPRPIAVGGGQLKTSAVTQNHQKNETLKLVNQLHEVRQRQHTGTGIEDTRDALRRILSTPSAYGPSAAAGAKAVFWMCKSVVEEVRCGAI
jgi:hypothetical protein